MPNASHRDGGAVSIARSQSWCMEWVRFLDVAQPEQAGADPEHPQVAVAVGAAESRVVGLRVRARGPHLEHIPGTSGQSGMLVQASRTMPIKPMMAR